MEMKELGYYIFMEQQEKKQEELLKGNAAEKDHLDREMPTSEENNR